MKKLLILTLCGVTTALFLAPQTQAQENKMVQFHLVIFRLGPKAATTKEAEQLPIIRQHIDNSWAMVKSGKAVVGGSILDADNSHPSEVFILRASSAEEAKSWIESDPAIRAGLLSAEIHPWWSEDIFRKDPSLQFERVYLGFLKRGPNRKEGDGKTPEVQELQKAHIANINRLAETKKLVVAGPFAGSGELRGIFVFRVGSLKEAQDLAATDPMIKIDRLRLELYAWWVPGGVIP